jgi:ATP-dependent Clp protease ATP-binding subunit ClpX
LTTRNGSLCDICGSPSTSLRLLPNGSTICQECAEFAEIDWESLEEMGPPAFILRPIFKPIPPMDMKAHLDEYVIGQDRAKKTLSVAIYNHFKRINSPNNEVPIKKSNIIMVGPSGSGKTLLIETMAKKLGVPFAIYDATSLTSAGYVGEDVENVLTRLLQNCDYDMEKAEKGIVYIDEIDKIAKMGDNVSITRDVSGECVQQSLLKIIESSIVNVPKAGGRKMPGDNFIEIDTTNILFIVGGAFDGIDRLVQYRTKKESKSTSSIGFMSQEADKKKELTKSQLYTMVKTEDLLKFGMIPEFLGRLPVLVSLEELDIDALKKILVEPKDSIIKQYQSLFAIDGIQLEIEDEALEEIAKISSKRGTGARGLRGIIEEAMIDIMFKLPSIQDVEKCIVKKETITENKEPELVIKQRA